MRRVETAIPGLVIIEPVVHRDDRGFFLEAYREDALADAGVTDIWVQGNHARSVRGVRRGMHFALPPGQAKLVRCVRGSIFDVCVDLRQDSPTYGKWDGVTLDDENLRLLYVPVGLAHGYCVTSEIADVMYRCSAYYDPALEREFSADDPDVGIAWPDIPAIVSERDENAPLLRDIAGELPFRIS